MNDISTHLGKVVQYESSYNPQLLVKEPRINNRTSQNITSDFDGYDVWNIYEISFLLDNGYPVNGIGKLVYKSDSECIVESKSLKLYFFSFNMTRMGSTIDTASKAFIETVTNDLSNLLQTPVEFQLHTDSYNNFDTFGDDYKTISYQDLDYSIVNEKPELLHATKGQTSEQLHTNIMRSNCKITHQPDWADIYVKYTSNKQLDHGSFLRYIVSFRNENHFHEECIETIFDRLFKLLEPQELLVVGKYTRRGGLDINPVRYHNCYSDVKGFINKNSINVKTLRQ